MLTVAIFAGLLASFAAGAVLLLAATRIKDNEDIWWPLLLGSEARSLPKADRLAILERLASIQDAWRHPILLCAKEQERDHEILRVINDALKDEA